MIQKLLLLAASLLFTLACGEVMVRWVAPQEMYRFPKGLFASHYLMGYKLAADFDGTLQTSEYQTSVRTNAAGLREDREYERKDPSSFRILALGDSFTMGVGVEQKDTYIKRLEDLLRSSGTGGYEVINAGVPGYNTKQEVSYLLSAGVKLQPDLVLLNLYVGNDIVDSTVDPLSFHVKDGYLYNREPKEGILPLQFKLFLSRHSHLYHLLWPIQRRFFDESFSERQKKQRLQMMSIYEIPDGGFNSQRWVTLRGQLKQFADSRTSHPFALAVVLIPELIQINRDAWDATVRSADPKAGDQYQTDLPNRTLVRLCEDMDIPALDLLPVFAQAEPGNPLYFQVDSHWTPRGNLVAAGAVNKFVQDYLTSLDW